MSFNHMEFEEKQEGKKDSLKIQEQLLRLKIMIYLQYISNIHNVQDN